MTQRGFTLIEVLVASAIFVGVMVIGVSSFSNVNHVSDQIQMTRNLSQTGNFVMETLARDIRSATGVKDPNTGAFGVNFPFDFLNNDSNSLVISDLPSASDVISSQAIGFNQSGQYSCFTFDQFGDTNYFDLMMHVGSCGTSSSPLLPSNIKMLKIGTIFSGISHQASAKMLHPVQPFVTIKFTLVDTTAPNPEAPSAQMTFQTTVTSLAYSGQ